MRVFSLIVLILTGILQAQDSTYQRAYERAMSDSVVTEDEQAILDIISPPDSVSGQQAVEMTADQNQQKPLNQEGRWRLIYSTMAIGNSLYGVGIPYLLESETPSHYLGFQLLAAAGGFYLSYSQTLDMDIPVGRTSFIERGAILGLMSFFPVHAMVGPTRWAEFDPHARKALTYAMVGVPLGAYYGNKVYNKWQPTDGQALMITGGGTLGSANGFAIYRLLYSGMELGTDQQFRNAYRIMSTLTFGGHLAGMYYSNKYLGEKPYTIGDALFVPGVAALGFYVGLHAINIFDTNSERVVLLTEMLLTNGFAWGADRMVADVDFTQGDVAIMGLGAVAANGIWRGVDILLDGSVDSELGSALDITTSLLGFYTTYKSVKTRRIKQVSPSNQSSNIDLKVLPTLISDRETILPGLSIQLELN